MGKDSEGGGRSVIDAHSRNFPIVTEENNEKSVMLASFPADIQNGHLPNYKSTSLPLQQPDRLEHINHKTEICIKLEVKNTA
jgi:hypothetical protein